MAKQLPVGADVSNLLNGPSKSIEILPTVRRQAVQFKYDGIDQAENSMSTLGTKLPPNLGEKNDSSQIYRPLHHESTDSWEIDVCVGFAIRQIIIPCWTQVKQLGRSLVIFKVHKQPQICELFFMPRSEVNTTYKTRMPRTVELCDLYHPECEICIWAELYKPSNKAGRSSKTSASWLTDELCGAFGSRLTMSDHVFSKEWVEDTIRHVTSTQEEVKERAKAKAVKIDKARRRKDRQRQKKADLKKEKVEGEKQSAVETEAAQVAALKANRIPAPALQGVDWSNMRASGGSGGCAAEESDESDESESETDSD